MRQRRHYILAGLCAAYVAVAFALPVGLSVVRGFVDAQGRWTLAGLEHFFSYPPLADSMLNALKVAVATTVGAMALALPLAVLADRYRFAGRGVISALILVPLILPPFVGAVAMRKLLALGGPVNQAFAWLGLGPVDFLGGGFAAVVILEVLHLYPIMYLNASAALANVDPAMTEAARNLGAGRWRTFRRVTLPLIRPGLFAGGTLVFVWSFTEMGTPLVIGYDVLATKIYKHLMAGGEGRVETFAMVVVMLVSAAALYATGKLLFGRGAAAGGGRGTASTARRVGPLGTALIWTVFGAVTLLAVFPHVGVVLWSVATEWTGTILPEGYTLAHFREVFEKAQTWNSIVNSLRYASAATAIDVLVGLAIAYLVVRTRVRGRTLLDTAAMLPLAVPGLVIAMGYVALTARGGPLEFLGPGKDPTAILIIAYSVRRLPYMVRAVSAGLQQTPVVLEEAARNLGASPLRSVWRITVPLVAANILAGAILAFSFAMLEVSDSLVLAQTRDAYPITKVIYELSSQAHPGRAAAMGALGMALLTCTLVVTNLLLGKRLGAMFRV